MKQFDPNFYENGGSLAGLSPASSHGSNYKALESYVDSHQSSYVSKLSALWEYFCSFITIFIDDNTHHSKVLSMMRKLQEIRSSLMEKYCPNRGACRFELTSSLHSTCNLSNLLPNPSWSSVSKSLKLIFIEWALGGTDSKRIVPVKSKWDESMYTRLPLALRSRALPNWDTRWHLNDDASDIRYDARSNYRIFSLFLISEMTLSNAAKSGLRIIWISSDLSAIPIPFIGMSGVRLRWCPSRNLTVNDQKNAPQTNDRETGRKGEN